MGFLLCGLFEYSCVYSPADSADHAEECSRLHYFAEKDSLRWWCSWGYCSFVVLGFCCLGFVCDNLRDLRENRPFTHKERAREEQGQNK